MNSKIIVSIVIVLLIWNDGSTQDTAEKDFYNLRKIRKISDLGVFNIKLSENKIFFHSKHEKISSPLTYENLATEFNFNNIYSIKDDLDQTYYFRFGWVSFINDQTVFSDIEWINKNRPPASDIYRNYSFSVADIDFIQFGKMTLCTIGDSQTWWSNAQSLRKYINESLRDMIFIGTNTDINGYGHEGEGGNSTQQLLGRINYIPKADYYTLLIGTNDWKHNIDTAYSNILKIINYISEFNPDSRIIYLTPIPTTNKARDNFNVRLSEKLSVALRDFKQVAVLDLGGEMRKNSKWQVDYLGSDGLHQSIGGIRFMADCISEGIGRIMSK